MKLGEPDCIEGIVGGSVVLAPLGTVVPPLELPCMLKLQKELGPDTRLPRALARASSLAFFTRCKASMELCKAADEPLSKSKLVSKFSGIMS